MRRMRHVLIVLPAIAATFLASNARGQDNGAAIAQQGNDRGAAPCVSCHGASGEGNADIGAPRLAALGTPYILEQLGYFADGGRSNEIMTPIAQALSPEERRAVAAYYSALPAAKARPATAAETSPGARLAERGRWAEGLPACAQCHGPRGIGVREAFPSLAGLPQPYIVEQLQAWKTGARPPGPLGLMPAIAKKLSEDDIATVAGYFASMAAPPEETSR